MNGDQRATRCIGFLKDTVIEGKNYQAISNNGISYAYFIRRDSTQKVFVYDDWKNPDAHQGDRLIYDFSLEPGDTLELVSPVTNIGIRYPKNVYPLLNRLIVDSVDTITISKPHKRLHLHSTEYNEPHVEIIDGIGTINHFFLSPYLKELSYPDGYEFTLLSFYEPQANHNFASGCIMNVDEAQQSEFKVFPNPALDHIKITGIEDETSFTLFNTLGEAALKQSISRGNAQVDVSHLEPGLYIYRIENTEKTGKLMIR